MAFVSGFNGGLVKTQVTLQAAGITTTNCAKIYQIKPDGSGFLVYDPTIGVGNQFTTLEVGLVYLFVMKTAGLNMDAYLQAVGGVAGTVLASPTLTATPISSTQVSLSAPTNANAVSYRFEQLNGSAWSILQNTGSNTFSVTNLMPSTAYQFRLKLIGDGTNYADSAYATANATTTSAADFFYDDGSGAAGNYTSPNAGVTTGTITRDGNGKLVFASGGYAVLQVNGIKPTNRKVVVAVTDLDVETDPVNTPESAQIELRQNTGGTQYLNAVATRASSTQIIVRIVNQAGEQAISAALTAAPPFTLEASINNNVVSAKINNLTPITYTDTSGNPEYSNVQSPNGMTVDSILVQAL